MLPGQQASPSLVQRGLALREFLAVGGAGAVAWVQGPSPLRYAADSGSSVKRSGSPPGDGDTDQFCMCRLP